MPELFNIEIPPSIMKEKKDALAQFGIMYSVPRDLDGQLAFIIGSARRVFLHQSNPNKNTENDEKNVQSKNDPFEQVLNNISENRKDDQDNSQQRLKTIFEQLKKLEYPDKPNTNNLTTDHENLLYNALIDCWQLIHKDQSSSIEKDPISTIVSTENWSARANNIDVREVKSVLDALNIECTETNDDPDNKTSKEIKVNYPRYKRSVVAKIVEFYTKNSAFFTAYILAGFVYLLYCLMPPTWTILDSLIQLIVGKLGWSYAASHLSTAILGFGIISLAFYVFYRVFIKEGKTDSESSQYQRHILGSNETEENLFSTNPIARLWAAGCLFLTWLYVYGLKNPGTMLWFGVGFFTTMLDCLYVFLPSSLHAFNMWILNGMVNLHYVSDFGYGVGCMFAGFFVAKLILLIFDTCTNGKQSLLYQTSEKIYHNPIDFFIFLSLLILISMLEAGIPAISLHIGAFKIINYLVFNIKPILMIIDIIHDPKRSFLGSMVMVVFNPLSHLWKERFQVNAFWKILKDLFDLTWIGFSQIIIAPFNRFVFPVLTVISIAIANTFIFFIRLLNAINEKIAKYYYDKKWDCVHWCIKTGNNLQSNWLTLMKQVHLEHGVFFLTTVYTASAFILLAGGMPPPIIFYGITYLSQWSQIAITQFLPFIALILQGVGIIALNPKDSLKAHVGFVSSAGSSIAFLYCPTPAF
ncbi:hypothetical protein N9Y17_04905, partial [Gammaproteobacteria bacterium]|nr:hypothetical protein [Gammaproteobacteria bacterium]